MIAATCLNPFDHPGYPVLNLFRTTTAILQKAPCGACITSIEHPQGKLVRVVRGEVFDVAVDMRESSSTFGQWVARVLSEQNKELLWIPPGFAHGFLVLSDEADFVYKCTDYYTPGDEYAVRWDDPDLAIEWPLALITPKLSEKDAAAPRLKDALLFP